MTIVWEMLHVGIILLAGYYFIESLFKLLNNKPPSAKSLLILALAALVAILMYGKIIESKMIDKCQESLERDRSCAIVKAAVVKDKYIKKDENDGSS